MLLIITGSIIGALAFIALTGIRIVRPTERAVIETLGKYSHFAGDGFNWIVPFFQRMLQVNVTERMADVDPLDMITKDNLNARVDLVVYYKVKPTENDIKKSLYNVNDVESQIISLAQTTARNIIGDMVFKDVNSKRNTLNTQLAKILDEESNEWGIQVVRVELKEITPPQDVQETMKRVIKAENEKDAANDFATARETEADGIKRAKIKEAEGEKQSTILKAQGQAAAFELIEKSFKGRAELLRRLEVTENSLKNNTKIVLTEKGISPSIIMDAIPFRTKE